MEIVILCPGPSLATFQASPGHTSALRIGVNKVPSLMLCDWWVFGDPESFAWYPSIGVPKIFTSAAAVMRIKAEGQEMVRHRWTVEAELPTTCPSDARWQMFSMLRAMVLAEWLFDGAAEKNIVIYGCDWKGNADVTGEVLEPRNEGRWKNECHRFERVCKWLTERGVVVNRVVPEVSSA